MVCIWHMVYGNVASGLITMVTVAGCGFRVNYDGNCALLWLQG